MLCLSKQKVCILSFKDILTGIPEPTFEQCSDKLRKKGLDSLTFSADKAVRDSDIAVFIHGPHSILVKGPV